MKQVPVIRKPTPRPYQMEARDNFLAGTGNMLIQLPTGTGKTLTSVIICEAYPGERVLFLAPTGTLVYQTCQAFMKNGLWPNVEKAEEYRGTPYLPDEKEWRKMFPGGRPPTDAFVADRVWVSTIQSFVDRVDKYRDQPFDLVVCDEAHRSLAKSWVKTVERLVSFNSSTRVLGLSVGPNSVVELRGGCFGKGYVGSISGAFDVAAASGYEIEDVGGLEVITLRGEESRGWTGERFGWKACKKIIRHPCDKDCVAVKVRGSQKLVATVDHSVYRLTKASYCRPLQKHRFDIECPASSDLKPGDVLMGDDGSDWGEADEQAVDMIEFAAKHMTKSPVHVACDVRSISRESLRAIKMTHKQIYAARKRGSLPLSRYQSLGAGAAPAIELRLEGSECRVEPKIRLSDWAYVLGFYLGDGWLGGQNGVPNRVSLATGSHQTDAVFPFVKFLRGVSWQPHVRKMPGRSDEIRACNPFVAKLIQHYIGGKCWEKKIPGEWIIKWGHSARRKLLLGLIESDGHRQDCGKGTYRHSFVTSSKMLADTVMSLLRSLGVNSSVTPRRPSKGGVVDGRRIAAARVSYHVNWSGNAEYGNNRKLCGNRQRFAHGNRKLKEVVVRGVEPCDRPEFVYDFEMDGHPSFVADGVLVHNTATPYRGDKQNLGKLFPEFAYRMPIVKGIDDGWLVDVVCERAVLPGVDESMWKMGSGKGGGRDVTDESLAKSMNNRVCIEAIAHEVIERAGTRKGILFLPGVAVTESVSEALNALKPGCSTFIHGSVKPKRDNRRRVRMIEDGKVQFVCGCDALIEGFDVPDIALVVMARFTAQRGRYEQMLGRGLRVLAKSIEGLNTPAERKAAIAASAKPNCAVLDFANSSRFRLMSVEDILLDPTDEGGGKRAKERADFVRANRDPADKRAMREQLDILDSIYALQEAARKNAGPPPKLEWQYERANLFGYGGSVVTPTVGKKTDARRPTSEMVRQAEDLFVENAEGMTQGQLQAEIARRKERMAGKKGFGFLVYGCKIPPADVKRLRLNWHDAHYLRRLLKSSGRDTLPGNWQDMVAKNRQQRLQGVANG